MIIKPIAAESYGVRSFCFFISTPDLNILLDPGCALGPKRFGLHPHKTEFNQLYEKTHEILHYSKKSDLIFISHYHHDHFKPRLPKDKFIYTNHALFDELYDDKLILCKRTDVNINRNQKIRGIKFFKDIMELRRRNGTPEKKIIRIGQDSSLTPKDSNKILIKLAIDDDIQLKSILYDAFSIGNTYLFLPEEFAHGLRKDGVKIYIQPLIVAYSDKIFYFFPDVQGFSCIEDLERIILLKEKLTNYLNEITVENPKNPKNPKNPQALNNPKMSRLQHIIALGGVFARTSAADLPNHSKKLGDSNLSNELIKMLQPTLKIIEQFDRIYIDHHIIRIPHFHKIFSYFNSIQQNNDRMIKISALNQELNLNAIEKIYNLIGRNLENKNTHEKYNQLKDNFDEIKKLINKNKLYFEIFRKELHSFFNLHKIV